MSKNSDQKRKADELNNSSTVDMSSQNYPTQYDFSQYYGTEYAQYYGYYDQNGIANPPVAPVSAATTSANEQTQKIVIPKTIIGAFKPTKSLESVPKEPAKKKIKKQTQEPAQKQTSIAPIQPIQSSKPIIRSAGGEIWQDQTLDDWDPNDYRLFCGDLGKEVRDEMLAQAFKKYPSFQKAKVVRDKRLQKSKGYGFVSFKSADDYLKAFREMNGKYIGSQPVKLRKSNWKDRNITQTEVKKITKEGIMHTLPIQNKLAPK